MASIIQSQNDKRVYKSLTLPNKLQCLLISDPETQKSAAAMNVNVGSFEDPKERQGIAHFLEHMLFLGSEKYPSETEYRDYISQNSGSCNAYTSVLHTNYIFQIANKAYEGCLDRFSQFFISPLFSESGTEREMKAVDSEFNMNLQQDLWRRFQILHNISDPDTKYNRFTIGNTSTLKFPDTREYLLDFHKKYYSANIMKLVMLSSESTEEMEKWATSYFSQIKNINVDVPSYDKIPFDESRLAKLVKYVPVNDDDSISIKWLIQHLHPFYKVFSFNNLIHKNNPGNYISHLLGHEGKGSLLSLLIDEGLAQVIYFLQELSCGPYNDMRLFSFMDLKIKLTKKGLNEIEKVFAYIYQYIAMLKKEGVQKWIFDEIKQTSELRFQFLEKSSPYDYVSTLASRLHYYSTEEVLKAPYFMEEYQPELFQSIVDSLNFENMIVFVGSKDFEGKLSEKEKYFGTEFQVQNLPESCKNFVKNPFQVKANEKQITLPPKNIFLPENVNLLEQGDIEQPQLIYETDKTMLFYQKDNEFKIPKAMFYGRIYCNDMSYGKNRKTEVLQRIWTRLLEDYMREFQYLADQASLESSIESSANGLQTTVKGYNSSLETYIPEFFKMFLSFDVRNSKKYYEDTYLRIKRSLINGKKRKLFQVIRSYEVSLLRDGSDYTYEELLDALNFVTFDDLVYFQEQWLKTVRMTVYVMGNIQKDVSVNLVKHVEDMFKNCLTLKKEEVLQLRPVKLTENEIYQYKLDIGKDETNSVVQLIYQQGEASIKDSLINDLLSTIIKNPFFEQLRTQEQLGYAVFSMPHYVQGVIGFNFLIQSNVNSPLYCQQRIEHFIQGQMLDKIKNLSEEEFQKYKQSVKVPLVEKDYRQNQQTIRNWTEIMRNRCYYDISRNILEEISLQEIKERYESTFLKNVKKLEMYGTSLTHQQENDYLMSERKDKVIVSTSIPWIKRRLELYPDFHQAQTS